MVADEASVAFLKWCLPQLGLRWPGYRKVRRLVGKRFKRRLAELKLPDLDAYRVFLIGHPGEWQQLDAMCRIPISRFYRDRGVFDVIGRRLLPEALDAAIRRGQDTVRCWSAGCASGEEPYTLALFWRFVAVAEGRIPGFTVIATDVDEMMLRRAEIACYARSSLKEVPPEWIARAFAPSAASLCLLPEFRSGVRFELQDIRTTMPEGPFDLILCRNMVFTYFDEATQRRLLKRMIERLLPDGFLVLGAHETTPPGDDALTEIQHGLPIYRQAARATRSLPPQDGD